MGTSSAFGGQTGTTPLIPSWLVPAEGTGNSSPDIVSNDHSVVSGVQFPPPHPPIPPSQPANRFTSPRKNFFRYVQSRGSDRVSLGRALSQYVRTSSGGSRTAAARMGSARIAGSRLLGFLSDAVARGTREALRSLNLAGLAGRPIEEVFLGLVDYICPDGGNIDEGIAREAFVETIVDLAAAGVTDLDTLTQEQMQTVFELYVTNAIEARIYNDIGTKIITLPEDIQDVIRVQAQLHDFILRCVRDAYTQARMSQQVLTPDHVSEFVDRVYEQAFEILRIMGDREGRRL